MTTAPPPARQRLNPRGRAAALPSSYTITGDTTRQAAPTSQAGSGGGVMSVDVIRFGRNYCVQPGSGDCNEVVRAVIDECKHRRFRTRRACFCTRRLREQGLIVRIRTDVLQRQRLQHSAQGEGSAA